MEETQKKTKAQKSIKDKIMARTTPSPKSPLLVYLLLIISKELVQCVPAYQIYKKKRNKIDLNLNSTISEQKTFLGVNWFIEYKMILDASQNMRIRYDPLIRIAAVTDKEIYLKKFLKSWFDLDKDKPFNRAISPLFSTTNENKITAYHMNDNQTYLVAALQNLTVLTFDLSKEPTTTKDKPPVLEPVMIFNATYVNQEGGEMIRSIYLIPYTNHLILSPNRFQVFKIDQISGEELMQKRSFLDSTEFILGPIPTHRASIDPHNPSKSADKRVNARITKMTES